MVNGIAVPADWLRIIFNPSFPYRLAHMATAAYLTTSFVVLAVGARYTIAGKYRDEARTMLRMGIGFAAIVAPLQLFIGDQHGLNTLQHQPMKIAAMEGNWDVKGSAPLVLFAIPDQKNQTNHFEISIPKIASYILAHDGNASIPNLKSVPPDRQPPVANVFFAFRIMVGIGLFMIGSAWLGAFLWWRRRLFGARWYLWPAQHVWFIGFVAVISGWFVTEQGRQPWVIYGVMRTADAISPVPGGSVLTTLAMFVLVYGVVFSMGIYYINRLIANGPEAPADEERPDGAVPNRPISTAKREGKRVLDGL
jgi:cytochrome d ubiquinol oxidase subunit I